MKLLFFDTETTSVKPGSICQLSYITIDASKSPQITNGHNYFFTVDEMEPSAEAIHGFSLEKLYDLSEGKFFDEQVEEFYQDFKEADFVIGHNVQFDIKFLKHELLLLGEMWEPTRSFCTMAYYKDLCKLPSPRGNNIKNPKLSEVIEFLNISEIQIKNKANELFEGSGNYHDARFDTAATYLAVIEGMKKGYIKPRYFTNLKEKF